MALMNSNAYIYIAIVSTNTKCFESMHAQCNYINIIIMIITVYIYHKHNILCVHMDFKMRQIIIIIIIEINYYNTMIYIVQIIHQAWECFVLDK